jgi:hypothetical protein
LFTRCIIPYFCMVGCLLVKSVCHTLKRLIFPTRFYTSMCSKNSVVSWVQGCYRYDVSAKILFVLLKYPDLFYGFLFFFLSCISFLHLSFCMFLLCNQTAIKSWLFVFLHGLDCIRSPIRFQNLVLFGCMLWIWCK